MVTRGVVHGRVYVRVWVRVCARGRVGASKSRFFTYSVKGGDRDGI